MRDSTHDLVASAHVRPLLVVQAVNLHIELVEITRADLGQNLLPQLLTTRAHDLLGDLEPLTVDLGGRVDVAVDDILVATQEFNDRVVLVHKHIPLVVDLQHALGLEILRVVLGVLLTPLQAFARVLLGGKTDTGCRVVRLGKGSHGVPVAGLGDFIGLDAANGYAEIEWKLILLLQDSDLVQDCILQHGRRRHLIGLRLETVIHTKNVAKLSVEGSPGGRFGARRAKLVDTAVDLAVKTTGNHERLPRRNVSSKSCAGGDTGSFNLHFVNMKTCLNIDLKHLSFELCRAEFESGFNWRFLLI